jgi:hypothetical protein
MLRTWNVAWPRNSKPATTWSAAGPDARGRSPLPTNGKRRAAAARAIEASGGTRPLAWQTLIDDAQTRHRQVQEFKKAVGIYQVKFEVMEQEQTVSEQRRTQAQQRLGKALRSFVVMNPGAAQALLSVSNDVDERPPN